MSATLKSFLYRLMNKQRGNIFLYINGKLQPLDMFACTPAKLNLTTPYDYSHIKSLTFFHEKEQLEKIAAQVISSNRKAVFFIQSTERALELYRKFKNNMVFSCSKGNLEYKKYMNETLIASIADNCTFDSAILVTTAALDSGFTLKDSAINTIVVDMMEPETVIQCVGRKRPINNDDKIDLYIRGRTNEEVNRSLQQMVQDIKSAKLFFENEEEYHISNHRQNSANNVIYNRPIGYDDNGNLQYVKSPNYSKIARLEYYAYNLFPSITKAKIKFGYDKYLARHFGFFDDESKQYTYKVLSSKRQTLIEYLDSIIGVKMFTPKDRKPLIDKIGLKDYKGKLQKNLITLNTYLQDENLPYTIVSRRETKTVDGAKKNYTAVWTLLKA